MITNLLAQLSKYKLSLNAEKILQKEIAEVLRQFQPADEFRLDDNNIIDFYLPGTGIGIEVKIKGSRKEIYKQCLRYCEFDRIKILVLVTNRSLGFPKTINGKPCYVVNLGTAWL